MSSRYPSPRVSSSTLSASSFVTSPGSVRASTRAMPPSNSSATLHAHITNRESAPSEAEAEEIEEEAIPLPNDPAKS